MEPIETLNDEENMLKKYVGETNSPDISNFETFPQEFGKLFCLILYII